MITILFSLAYLSWREDKEEMNRIRREEKEETAFYPFLPYLVGNEMITILSKNCSGKTNWYLLLFNTGARCVLLIVRYSPLSLLLTFNKFAFIDSVSPPSRSEVTTKLYIWELYYSNLNYKSANGTTYIWPRLTDALPLLLSFCFFGPSRKLEAGILKIEIKLNSFTQSIYWSNTQCWSQQERF